MKWFRCMLCQGSSQDNVRGPVLSKNKEAIKIYKTFLIDLQACRTARIFTLEYLTPDLCSVQVLLKREAKWHKNCRRKFQEYGLQHNFPSNSGNESSVARFARSSGRSDAVQNLFVLYPRKHL